MKNKLLVFAFVVASFSALMTSCREKTDFDGIANDLSKQTLQGYFSGAATSGDEMKLNVIQFEFKENGSVERSVMTVGDRVYNAPSTRKFSSWKFGDYYDGRAGRFLFLNPEDGGEPLRVRFFAGGIIEDNQPAAQDNNDKVGSLAASQEAIVSKKWLGNDTTYHKVDTTINIMKYDTAWSTKRIPETDPERIEKYGKWKVDDEGNYIMDRVIKKVDSTLVPTKMKWPVAPKTINIRSLELYRDASTFANTGKWTMVYVETEMDKNRVITVTKDTTSSYNFNWCFESYASPSAFVIKAKQSNGKEELFDIKYDGKIPAVTLDKQVLRIAE